MRALLLNPPLEPMTSLSRSSGMMAKFMHAGYGGGDKYSLASLADGLVACLLDNYNYHVSSFSFPA